MLVAGHRGARVGAPENTMEAFELAARAGVDMIETDVHMTRDHQLVLMHDARLDRTTDATGLIREMTLKEIKAAAPQVPTLEEFLEGMKPWDTMQFNVELKEYPEEDEAWAVENTRRTIAMLDRYGVSERCLINSFSAAVLEMVDQEYDHRFRLHGFYPFHVMKSVKRDPKTYLYCACLWPTDSVVACEDWYRTLEDAGIQPWIGAAVKTADDLRQSAMRGARLVTADDPVQTLAYLREMGRHA